MHLLVYSFLSIVFLLSPSISYCFPFVIVRSSSPCHRILGIFSFFFYSQLSTHRTCLLFLSLSLFFSHFSLSRSLPSLFNSRTLSPSNFPFHILPLAYVTMSSLQPYEQACLAPDPFQNRVFLAGTIKALDGQLQVSSVDLYDMKYPAVNFFSHELQANKWRTFLPKYCFSFPAEMNLPSGGANITVIQLGDKESLMAPFEAQKYGGSSDPVPLKYRLVSPKHIALNGLYATTGLFTIYTNTTETNQ